MNLNEINKLAKEIATEYWGLDFNIPIEISGKLTTALGYYRSQINRVTGKRTPIKITLAKRLFGNYSKETIIGVLKHELCHWALSVQGKPFKDGDLVFERELKRIGSHSTGTVDVSGNVHIGICSKCHKKIVKGNSYGKIKRYLKEHNTKGYHSRCCKAQIEYGGVIFIKDEGTPSAPINQPQNQNIRERSSMTEQAKQEVKKEKDLVNEKLDSILTPGNRGVSNMQMIPAIKAAIDLESIELLEELQETYPTIFASSFKYLKNDYQTKYKQIFELETAQAE